MSGMTPERLAEIKQMVEARRVSLYSQDCGALIDALEAERARLDTLAHLRPGELFDALSDPRGLRAVLDERIFAAREREKGAAR